LFSPDPVFGTVLREPVQYIHVDWQANNVLDVTSELLNDGRWINYNTFFSNRT
jgi:hypothetical protein